MLGGKVKNIEDTIRKLVEVLTAVNIKLFSDLSILQQCSQSLLQSSWQGKMFKPQISLNYVQKLHISHNTDSNLKKHGFFMLNPMLKFKSSIMLSRSFVCF